MRHRILRAFASAAVVVLTATPALAHTGHSEGDLEIVVGFGTEPAFAGQPNSVQLIISHGGEPVTDLGDTLDVEVGFGEGADTLALPLEPFFGPGFGTPGDYRAWFIPTRAGQYSFNVTGTIEGEDIDETFTSGPDTFSDVENPAEIQFPAQDPTTGELAERIEREIPRIGDDVDEVRAAAIARAEDAEDAAASARTFALVAFVVGALGLALGAGAFLAARKRS